MMSTEVMPPSVLKAADQKTQRADKDDDFTDNNNKGPPPPPPDKDYDICRALEKEAEVISKALIPTKL